MTIPDAGEIVAELERLLPDWIDLEPGRWQRVEYALRHAEADGPVFPTFESFVAWVDEDTSAEWENGEVVFISPASTKHQLLVGFLFPILKVFVEHHQLEIVLTAPFKMKLPGYGAEPDILFLAKAQEDRLRKTFLDGPADLVVEVISPDSVERDRIKKFNDYEAAGIPEYWLVDPERESAEFYQLTDGHYQLIETPRGVYFSGVLPGFELPLTWFSHSQQPTLVESLHLMGIL